MARSSGQKINKDISTLTESTLNDMLGQINLRDIYRIFHPKAAEYTFFSNVHGTFSGIEHKIGHKSLNKFYFILFF